MPEAPPAEPSFSEAIAAAGAHLDFKNLNANPATPAAPPAPASPPPSQPKPPIAPPAAPASPSAPTEPKRPAVPPLKAPPAAPAAPSAPGAEDIPPVPDVIKSTKAAEHWEKIHNEAKTLRAEVATTKAELAKVMEMRSKVTPEVETLKTQLHEMSERLRIKDVESHPQFQAYFGNKTAAAIALARSAAGVEKAEEVTRILQLPESDYRTDQLDALVADLSDSRKGRIISALNELDHVNFERSQAIERAKKDGTTADQQRQQEVQARQAKVKQAFDSTIREAQEHIPAFQLREGDEAWNQSVTERVALAEHIFSGNMPFEDLARATIWAASAPVSNQMLLESRKEIEALKAENASLRAKAPSPSGGGDAPPPPDDIKSFSEAIDRAARANPEMFRQGGWGR